MKDWRFELVTGPLGTPLDGPLWDGGALLVCRVLESDILRIDLESGQSSVVRRYTLRTSGLAFGPQGHLYGAQSGARRVVQFNEDGSTVYLAVKLSGAYHNHPHDLAVDSRGRIWFSDPYNPLPTRGPQMFPPLEHASVLRLDRDPATREWSINRATFDTANPRGLALAPDEHTLYVAESSTTRDGTREIRAYPVRHTDGTLAPPRVLHTFGSGHPGASGMCTDREGKLLVCAAAADGGPGALVYVFEPAGRLLGTQPIPAGQPTNCAFAGPGMDTLVVTTNEGHLYRARHTGHRGLQPPASAAGVLS